MFLTCMEKSAPLSVIAIEFMIKLFYWVPVKGSVAYPYNDVYNSVIPARPPQCYGGWKKAGIQSERSG